MIVIEDTSFVSPSKMIPAAAADVEDFLPAEVLSDVSYSVSESRQLHAYFAWLREQNLR